MNALPLASVALCALLYVLPLRAGEATFIAAFDINSPAHDTVAKLVDAGWNFSEAAGSERIFELQAAPDLGHALVVGGNLPTAPRASFDFEPMNEGTLHVLVVSTSSFSNGRIALEDVTGTMLFAHRQISPTRFQIEAASGALADTTLPNNGSVNARNTGTTFDPGYSIVTVRWTAGSVRWTMRNYRLDGTLNAEYAEEAATFFADGAPARVVLSTSTHNADQRIFGFTDLTISDDPAYLLEEPEEPETPADPFADVVIPIVPGTGSLAHRVDFEASGSFNYGAGWAGAGLGLSGTQRGAPEQIWEDTPPPGALEGSTRALFFRRLERDSAWYEEHPGAVGHPVYGQPDQENQDDFYVYARSFTAGERFSITVRVYVNLGRTARATFGLRTTAIVENTNVDPSEMRNVWPAVWLFKEDGGNGVFSDLRAFIRSPYGNYSEYIDLPNIAGWWTLGMSFDESGDIHYFARPGSGALRSIDYLASASRYGSGRHFRRNIDAAVMISTSNFDESEEGSVQIMDDIMIHTDGLDFYDLWAAEYFPEDAFENGRAIGMAVRNSDANGSGRTNFEEYFIGNHPMTSNPPFGLGMEANGNHLNLAFPSKANRSYTLERSGDLKNWLPLHEGIEGNDDWIGFTEEMTDAAAFYRIAIRPSYWLKEIAE